MNKKSSSHSITHTKKPFSQLPDAATLVHGVEIPFINQQTEGIIFAGKDEENSGRKEMYACLRHFCVLQKTNVWIGDTVHIRKIRSQRPRRPLLIKSLCKGCFFFEEWTLYYTQNLKKLIFTWYMPFKSNFNECNCFNYLNKSALWTLFTYSKPIL